MIQTKTLKTFVAQHERKLNAKISGLKARQMENEFYHDTPEATNSITSDAAQHWHLTDSDKISRRRPKSRYFNFILTATH